MTAIASPAVTFVVPCYKLSHLLAECVNSILSQTYTDFEILIMDDCSPDDTPEVARTFSDPRVVHVRNEPNLGHLRNYNKGIRRARGKYVWLISADDRLRCDSALERYVGVMESHPEVGYVFCSGRALDDHQEGDVIRSSLYRLCDGIFSGREFLLDLLRGNFVLAASGMVRKECYEKISYFPEDMPYAGDWYLWAVFALHYDVAYFAEPMVNYRVHDLSMSNTMAQTNTRAITRDIMLVPTRIRHAAEEMGATAIVDRCRECMIDHYADCIATREIRGCQSRITLEQFEEALVQFTSAEAEQKKIRLKVFCAAGDRFCWQKEYAGSENMYWRVLAIRPFILMVWIKILLLKSGGLGVRVREMLGVARRGVSF
jgi:glycosyltransferase involved in cell wall biosynthesis